MSFIRPEAKAALWRFGEPALYAALAVLGIWKGADLLWRGSYSGIVALVLGGVAALALAGAILRAWVDWRTRRSGPGTVSVREGQIAYFGPVDGAILAMDALVAVDIVVRPTRPVRRDWVLKDELGQMATIPASAEGATALLDRLSSLPGFENRTLVRAMAADAGPEDRRFPVWRRPPQGQIATR